MDGNALRKSWIDYISQKLASSEKVSIPELASASGTSPEKLREYIKKEILRKGHLGGVQFDGTTIWKTPATPIPPTRQIAPKVSRRLPKGKLAVGACIAVSIVVIIVLAQQPGLIPGISPAKHDLYVATSIGEAYWVGDESG